MRTLVFQETSFDVSDDKIDTLMSHGIIREVREGDDDIHYRLATAEELLADPGSTGVNNNSPVSLIAVLEALLTLGEDD